MYTWVNSYRWEIELYPTLTIPEVLITSMYLKKSFQDMYTGQTEDEITALTCI